VSFSFMQQVFLKNGQIAVEDVPAPTPGEKEVLVANAFSLISSGTEGAAVKSGAGGLLQKALHRPDLVAKVWQKVREEGIRRTWERVREKAGQPQPLGYSTAGYVLATGRLVTDIAPGEPVACAGAQCAHHAEIVAVPRNLVAKVPAGVDLQGAAFATLGAIALQGLRRAEPQLGETVVILGLGLLGLLAVQLARAGGCRVVGIDVDRERVELAARLGAELALHAPTCDAVREVLAFTNGFGADAVVIYAATPSSDPVNLAFDLCRQRGRVVGVGAFGLDLDRERMYRKELDFRMSTSYGPGRYDPVYEEEGVDYPVGYVRWTENRNLQEFLRLLSCGRMQVKPLITATFPVERAPEAYGLLQGDKKPLGVLLAYPAREGTLPDRDGIRAAARVNLRPRPAPAAGRLRVAVVGAGSFTREVHLPNLAALRDLYQIRAVVTAHGENAKSLAEKYGAVYAATDYRQVLADPEVDLVLIGTRHNLHYPMVMEALAAGKPVFVEKPLCLSREELEEIKRKIEETGLPVFVGFNRRHSPLARKLKEELARLPPPYLIHYRVNAGFLPADHWTQDPAVGGGRLIGEGCHFFDFFNFLVEREAVAVTARALPVDGGQVVAQDNFTATVAFADGSQATLLYTALGHTEMEKERVEVFAGGKSFVLEDYRRLTLYGAPHTGGWKRVRGQTYILELLAQDKGWREELRALAAALRDAADAQGLTVSPLQAMAVTLAAAERLKRPAVGEE